MTDGLVSLFGVSIGSAFDLDGVERTVVGIVENPSDLNADFALVAPPDTEAPDSITILVGGSAGRFDSFQAPQGSYMSSSRAEDEEVVAAALVIIAGTVVLALVALVAAAGFVVMAQRRLRQLGMLGAIGGSEGHVRFLVLTNGFIVGLIASIVGTVCGITGWILMVPFLEPALGYRIARYNVPWWLVATGVALGVVTATAAAWWPARSMSRVPIVQALSGRPSAPGRWHGPAAIAVLALVVGLSCLVWTNGDILSNEELHIGQALLTAGGLLATMLGVLLLSPMTIRALPWAAARMPVAVRLALRDLARYQARSGFALAAISLALGLAVAVVIIATSAQDSSGAGNLSSRQLLLWAQNSRQKELAAEEFAGGEFTPFMLETTPAELEDMEAQTDRIASSLGGATVTALDMAIDPTGALPGDRLLSLARRFEDGYEGFSPLYVAAPGLLAQYGIDIDELPPGTEVITDEEGELFLIGLADTGPDRSKLQPLSGVVRVPEGYTSIPGAFITRQVLEEQGWSTARAGWIIEADADLTDKQIAAAIEQAADTGLLVEARHRQSNIAPWLTGATVAGILVALSVLAMTVGLIRSETARDLRTLTATGATTSTRRTVTGATAGALGLLGAVVGTAGAYTVLLALNYDDIGALFPVPVVYLLVIIVGLPSLAAAAGWVLARGEPSGISRQAIT